MKTPPESGIAARIPLAQSKPRRKTVLQLSNGAAIADFRDATGCAIVPD
jgi:hypothetical protein